MLEVIAIEGTKKEPGASASVANRKRLVAKGTPNSAISIAHLLGLVNGEARKYIPVPIADKGVDYKLPVGEDTSPRALLANAFEGIVTNDVEKRNLEKYKSKVSMLNAEEQKLHELRSQIREGNGFIRFIGIVIWNHWRYD